MPQKRTNRVNPARTIRKPRLHTPEQVTDEKRKLYRDFINKRITRAEYEGHIKGLELAAQRNAQARRQRQRQHRLHAADFQLCHGERNSFLTDKQIEYHRIHSCLPPDDNEMHSAGAVKFHNKHGRYPTAEELAAAASASNNGFDDAKAHHSPEPIFTPDYDKRKFANANPDDGNVINMSERRAKAEADTARKEYLDSLPDDVAREKYLNTLSVEQLRRLAGVDDVDQS